MIPLKQLLHALALFSTTSTHALAQTTRPPASDIDARAARIVSPILERLDSAWNASDGPRFAAEFIEDADVINVSGDHIHSRRDIGTQMQFILNSVFKGSVHRSRTLELARFLSDSLILVVSSSVIDVPAGPIAPRANSRQTFILIAKGRAWLIQHWHNTPIRPR